MHWRGFLQRETVLDLCYEMKGVLIAAAGNTSQCVSLSFLPSLPRHRLGGNRRNSAKELPSPRRDQFRSIINKKPRKRLQQAKALQSRFCLPGACIDNYHDIITLGDVIKFLIRIFTTPQIHFDVSRELRRPLHCIERKLTTSLSFLAEIPKSFGIPSKEIA